MSRGTKWSGHVFEFFRSIWTNFSLWCLWGTNFSEVSICVNSVNSFNHHGQHHLCVMRKSSRNKAGKRKKNNSECNSSGEGDNPSHFKLFKPRGSSAEEEELDVSDILKRANSVLYDKENVFEKSVVSSTPLPQSKRPSEGQFEISSEMASLSQSEKNGEKVDKGEKGSSDSEILQFLKKIDQKITNMDKKFANIEKRLCSLEELKPKVELIDKELKNLWSAIQERDKRYGEKLNLVEERFESTDFSVGLLNDKVLNLQTENVQLKENIVYLQSQSMRNNLVFTGIPESESETNEEVENKIRVFLHENLKVAKELADKILFDIVHRMGSKSTKGPRQIVARFHDFKDKDYVKKQGRNLKGTSYFINEQFPKEVSEKRKRLLPKLKEARQGGKSAWLSYDTLYIDGKPVKD